MKVRLWPFLTAVCLVASCAAAPPDDGDSAGGRPPRPVVVASEEWQLSNAASAQGASLTNIIIPRVYLRPGDWLLVVVAMRGTSDLPSNPTVVWLTPGFHAVTTAPFSATHATDLMRLRQTHYNFPASDPAPLVGSVFVSFSGANKPQAAVAAAFVISDGVGVSLGVGVNDGLATTDPQWIRGVETATDGDYLVNMLRSSSTAQGTWVNGMTEIFAGTELSPAIGLTVARKPLPIGALESVGKAGAGAATWCSTYGNRVKT